jgi:hypothetical protein
MGRASSIWDQSRLVCCKKSVSGGRDHFRERDSVLRRLDQQVHRRS